MKGTNEEKVFSSQNTLDITSPAPYKWKVAILVSNRSPKVHQI